MHLVVEGDFAWKKSGKENMQRYLETLREIYKTIFKIDLKGTLDFLTLPEASGQLGGSHDVARH